MTDGPQMPAWSVSQDGNTVTLSLAASEGQFDLHIEWEPRTADDGEWILMTPPDHSFRVHDPVVVHDHDDAIDVEGVIDMRIAGPNEQPEQVVYVDPPDEFSPARRVLSG